MSSSVLGFVLATIFLAIYNNPRMMFIFLTVIGSIGTATMLFLSEPPGTRDPISFQFLIETIGLFREPRMLLIAGKALYFGARGGLIWGALPARFPPKLIGYTSICFGVAEVIGGLTFGKVSDRIGRKPVLFLGYLVESGALAVAGFARPEKTWACYLTMILFGFSDSILNVVVNAVLPVLQPQRTQAAFGCASTQLCFLSSLLLTNDICSQTFSRLCCLFCNVIRWTVHPIRRNAARAHHLAGVWSHLLLCARSIRDASRSKAESK